MNNNLKTEKVKIIKKVFKNFNEENGFYFKTPRVIMKDYYDIIHYLIINSHLERTVCDLVVQPLYIPETSLNLSISVRLQLIGETKRFPWGHCEGNSIEYEKDIEEILQIFSTDGLKWLSNFTSPKKIIETIDDWSIEKYKNAWHPNWRNEARAVSYLYLGNIQNATDYLQDALLETNEFQEHYRAKLQNWINLAQNHNLPDMFDEIILTTRKNLKLKDEKCELLNNKKEEQLNNSIILP